MKNKSTIKLVVILFSASIAAAQASQALRHNPFEQPDWLGNRAGIYGINADSGSMKLRGTVIDGDNSLVNIDGKYYRLQEEVSGYRIIQIESGSVTLRRGENETVLMLKDEK